LPGRQAGSAFLLGSPPGSVRGNRQVPSHKVRAFFGLPLPEPHRRALESYLSQCVSAAPRFRWTPVDNLHLTVRFLGHLDVAIAEGIADRLAAASPPAFELELGGVGSFSRGRLARVVWLGLRRGEAEAGVLAAMAETESVRAGLEPEGRKFHAHLTLARARERDGAALPELPAPPTLEPWTARELVLYRSHLGRAGSVYEPLRTVSLR
jgi:RNA 2',3'-cyclic 3'-phosphodiesterase